MSEVIGRNHIPKRIVERPKVGIDLLLDVARQKTEIFTGFNGWTGQDNTGDFLALERRCCTGHSQIVVFPVPAGPIPKTMSYSSIADT